MKLTEDEQLVVDYIMTAIHNNKPFSYFYLYRHSYKLHSHSFLLLLASEYVTIFKSRDCMYGSTRPSDYDGIVYTLCPALKTLWEKHQILHHGDFYTEDRVSSCIYNLRKTTSSLKDFGIDANWFLNKKNV